MEQTTENASPEPTPQGTRPGWLTFLIDTLETLFLALIFYVGVNIISARILVLNHSMEPTLYEGELVLLNKLAYKFNSPQRGDIVVFHYPVNPEEDFIKRAIGLPGDNVIIEDGKVIVNGQKIDEDYLAEPVRYNGSWQVPKDTLFVLGDNRNRSSDSHIWGYVPFENIMGKAICVYWPPSNWKIIQHEYIALSAQK